jgi:hypothetical protein
MQTMGCETNLKIPATNFKRIHKGIQTLEALIAEESRSLKTEHGKQAIDYAHSTLSDVVAEWVRTAEKAEAEK